MRLYYFLVVLKFLIRYKNSTVHRFPPFKNLLFLFLI